MKPILTTPFWVVSLVLAGFLALQGCETRPPLRPQPQELSTTAAQQAEQAGEYVIAAREYDRLAKIANPPQRQQFQLKAVSELIRAAQVREARQEIESIDVTGLDPSYSARKLILEARIASLEGHSGQTMTLLGKVARMHNLDPSLVADMYLTRAQTEVLLNRPMDAVNDFIARERYIASAADVTANQQQLWHVLQTLSRSDLKRALDRTNNSELAGWLQLAIAVIDNSGDPNQLAIAVDNWHKSHPDHPATELFLKGLASPVPGIMGRVDNIALLLPLTSEFATQASAVRDGFMAMDAANTSPDKPKITVYDTGADPTKITKFYDAAVTNGAQMVVGPLGLDAVDELVKANDFKVPTLLLSQTSQNIDPQEHVFQFGLPPEQEAAQAAERAYLDGHRRAAIMYPNTSWGQRMANGFSSAWQRLGGIVLTSVAYQPGLGDYSGPVEQLLNITQSKERKNRLEALLQVKLKFDPRPREDIDMIFLAADAPNGRLIKPQLNYYRAMEIPVYATSHIFTGKGDPVRDTDLDGIMFGDMPWMLVGNGKVEALRDELQHGNWLYAHTPLDRLYALGVDAYSIIPQLNRLSTENGVHFDGVTSGLSIGPDGRLRRQLLWAQFRQGVPQLLDTFLNYKGEFALDGGSGSAPSPQPQH